MPRHHHILLPYLIVSVLLLVGAAFFFYDSRTVLEAEEEEQDIGKILLCSESYLSGLQQTQIEQHHLLLTGKEKYKASFKREKEVAIHRLTELGILLGAHYPDSMPKIDAVERIQKRYFAELDRLLERYAGWNPANGHDDSERSSVYLTQIQLLLEQLAADIQENRNRINQSVSFSISRASVSVALMAVVLVAILAFGYRLTSRTLAANQQLAERLGHEATHDALTGLPNRRYFMDWIQHSVAMALRNEFSVALYFIDLDGFKHVNDRYGHDAGDAVLKAAAERFHALMRESDLLVRLGGDEFAVLVSQAPSDEELSALAERIVASLAEPIFAGERKAQVGASIGIAVYPRDASDAGTLICAADTAMYRAKEKGKNCHVFFHVTQSAKVSA